MFLISTMSKRLWHLTLPFLVGRSAILFSQVYTSYPKFHPREAADARARGFLLGATAGRTTLNGEGLQHQDCYNFGRGTKMSRDCGNLNCREVSIDSDLFQKECDNRDF